MPRIQYKPIVYVTILAILVGLLLMLGIRANAAPGNLQDPRIEEMKRSITTLEQDIAALEEQRREINEQIDAIHIQEAESETRISFLTSQLEQVRLRASLTELIGPGLIITLDDNKDGADKARASNPDLYFAENYIVHDKDLLYLVRMLATASEAVAINNVRLNDSSHIRCVGTVILVNDARLAPPYEIKAIGDPEELMRALMASSRYKSLFNRMMPIKANVAEEILLPAYSGTYTINYSKPAKEEHQASGPDITF